MAKKMNRRDALHYLSEVTTDRMKKKIKMVLKQHTEELLRKYPDTKIKTIKEKNAVRAYYNAVIDEAFKNTDPGDKVIRKTMDKAIEKIKNTNYYSTEDERFGRAILKGYEEMIAKENPSDKKSARKRLREKLGVKKIKPEYFRFLGYDENGLEIVQYEDMALTIKMVRNKDGDTEDMILDVSPVTNFLYGPNLNIKRRYSV